MSPAPERAEGEDGTPTPCPRPHHLLLPGERCPTCRAPVAAPRAGGAAEPWDCDHPVSRRGRYGTCLACVVEAGPASPVGAPSAPASEPTTDGGMRVDGPPAAVCTACGATFASGTAGKSHVCPSAAASEPQVWSSPTHQMVPLARYRDLCALAASAIPEVEGGITLVVHGDGAQVGVRVSAETLVGSVVDAAVALMPSEAPRARVLRGPRGVIYSPENTLAAAGIESDWRFHLVYAMEFGSPVAEPTTTEDGTDGLTLPYDQLANAYHAQVAHTDFVRAEYQRRVAALEARLASQASALAAAAEFVRAYDADETLNDLEQTMKRALEALGLYPLAARTPPAGGTEAPT